MRKLALAIGSMGDFYWVDNPGRFAWNLKASVDLLIGGHLSAGLEAFYYLTSPLEILDALSSHDPGCLVAAATVQYRF